MGWRLRPAGSFFLFAVTALAFGCARRHADEAAPPPAVAPPPPPSPLAAQAPASDLEALERELELNEERLSLYLPEPSGSPRQQRAESPESSAPRGSADATEESPSGRARPAPAKPKAEKKESVARDSRAGSAAPASERPETEGETRESDCALACRAFASMRRAAERICSLTGEADARCSRARSRVDEATRRIARAECVCPAE